MSVIHEFQLKLIKTKIVCCVNYKTIMRLVRIAWYVCARTSTRMNMYTCVCLYVEVPLGALQLVTIVKTYTVQWLFLSVCECKCLRALGKNASIWYTLLHMEIYIGCSFSLFCEISPAQFTSSCNHYDLNWESTMLRHPHTHAKTQKSPHWNNENGEQSQNGLESDSHEHSVDIMAAAAVAVFSYNLLFLDIESCNQCDDFAVDLVNEAFFAPPSLRLSRSLLT